MIDSKIKPLNFLESIILGAVVTPVFDDADVNTDTGADVNTDTDAGANADADANTATFTQEQVNNIVATERAKIQAKLHDTTAQIKNLSQTASLTKTQKEQLETQLETINRQAETDKQRLAREAAATKNKHEMALEAVTSERDKYKDLYVGSTIKTSIATAATENGAIQTSQVLAILQPNTTLIEDVDSEGNLLGSMSPVVKFTDTDADGKSVVVNYTPAEAVTRMKELESFSNLFKSTNIGGAGRKNDDASSGKPKSLKQASKTMEDYKAFRSSSEFK